MTVDLALRWKQPCVASLAEGVRLHYDDALPWLHLHFAIGLFSTSDALPMKASPNTLALETSRRVVAFERNHAEEALTAAGFVTRWTDEQCEAIAREMAEAMPQHKGVIQAVERRLAERRDGVFNDKSLTRNDELFAVYRIHSDEVCAELGNSMKKDGIEAIVEDAIETIDRSLDHLSELRSTKDYRQFIRLFRVLTSIRRVYDVIHPK
ncbi:hypothetical protein [Sphingobium chlorophenolicum]|uniref:Uncharacterized protein n=1 Tax=Sphingobium chlorophenolicum TaxID=46429 RepID=A0A081RDW4_SPHCR|nr:hypothetical protein [Sphingobium chlorophenolicum]KEQ53387.1 hypothetical protein BV95_02395 [Sphingobium chlorophenolicum]